MRIVSLVWLCLAASACGGGAGGAGGDPDEASPDAPSPDAPSPDAPSPDAASPDAPSPDAGAPPDAAASPDAAIGPLNATVEMVYGGPPPTVPAWVSVAAADGTLRNAVQTTAAGVAAIHVEPGDLVTAMFDQNGRWYTTVGGVQPGDHIILDQADAPSPTVTGSVQVSIIPIVIGSGYISIASDCDGNLGTASAPTTVRGCRADGLVDIEGVAISAPFPGPPREVGYALARGVALGSSVTLGAWQTPLTQHLALTVTGVPATGSVWVDLMRTGAPGLPWRPLGTVFVPSSAPTQTLDVAYDAAPADATRLRLYEQVNASGQWRQERRSMAPSMNGPTPASATLDVTASLPPRLQDGTLTVPIPGRLRVAWAGNAGQTNGYVRVNLATNPNEPNATTWTAYLPPGTTAFQIPELPAAQTSPAPLSPASVTSHVIEAHDQSDLPWDTARQGPYKSPPAAGPGATFAVSTLGG